MKNSGVQKETNLKIEEENLNESKNHKESKEITKEEEQENEDDLNNELLGNKKKRKQRRSAKDIEGRDFKCVVCGKAYFTKTTLRNHQKEKHNVSNNLNINEEVECTAEEKQKNEKNENNDTKIINNSQEVSNKPNEYSQFFKIEKSFFENKNDSSKNNINNINDNNKKPINFYSNIFNNSNSNNNYKETTVISSIIQNEKINEELQQKIDNENTEDKIKRKVRGPNRYYRIIDEFLSKPKRAKNINITDNELNKENNKNIYKKRRTINAPEKFDEFLIFAKDKVNDNYYNKFVNPIISSFKEYYIINESLYSTLSIKENPEKNDLNEKEDDEDNNKQSDEKCNEPLDSYSEIPLMVNEFIKDLNSKNIYTSNEDKIEMVEFIYIFCTWLKKNYYTTYKLEYILPYSK